MFKLTIKHEDGSVYWTEHFSSMDDLNKWLDEEKTRHYWDKDFTTQVEDLTQPPLSSEQLAEIQSKKEEIVLARDNVKDIDLTKINSIDDIKSLLLDIIKALGLK